MSPSDPFETELAEEFEHHLTLLREAELARGVDPALADARARERFGDPSRHARACRPITHGVFTMKRSLFIAWNVAVALALVFSIRLAFSAHRRVSDLGLQGAATPTVETRTAILRSIWATDCGDIRVEGDVSRPGGFGTSLSRPMSIAQLLEMAGASDNATLAVVTRPGTPGEWYVSVENAYRFRDDFNLMPEPGTVVTIR